MGYYRQYYPGAPFCGENKEDYERFVDDLVDVGTRKSDFTLSEMDIHTVLNPETRERMDYVFSYDFLIQRTNYKVPDMKLLPVGTEGNCEMGWYCSMTNGMWTISFFASPHWFSIYRYLEKHAKVTFSWSEPPRSPLEKFIPLIELEFSDYKRAEITMTIPDSVIDVRHHPPSTKEKLLISAVGIINGINQKLGSPKENDKEAWDSYAKFFWKDPCKPNIEELRSLI